MSRPTPAAPAMTRNTVSKPKRARFAAALATFLRAGARPGKGKGEAWSYEGFAKEVQSPRVGRSEPISPRTVSNWCKGTSLPTEIEPILNVLFGTSDRHAIERNNLDRLFRSALAEKTAATIKRAKLNPSAASWVAQGNQLVIDRTARPADERAARDNLQQQMQLVIHQAAAELAEVCKQPSNSRLLGKLSATASIFSALLKCDPQEMPKRLVPAYRLSLQLGEFLEIDIANRANDADAPLDPDIRGQLSVLIRTAAPWLRGFPSVAKWDDDARKSLVSNDLCGPALKFIQTFQEREVIRAEDAVDAVLWLSSDYDMGGKPATHGFLGQKARNLALADITNLFLTSAGKLAAAQSGAINLTPDEHQLVQRISETFISAKRQVEAFADGMQPDLRSAILSLVEEAQRAARAIDAHPLPPISRSVPENVEVQARAMILEGEAPPIAWRPYIHKLDFDATTLDGLELLIGLSTLRSLKLNRTKIRDLAPLSHIKSLRNLNLAQTQVSDVSALQNLTALESLNLNRTHVQDVSPLSHLTRLRNLHLSDTAVIDVTILANFAMLRDLDLGGTQVRNISALTSLTSLAGLHLWGTLVDDLSPVAALVALRGLYLRKVPAANTKPLANLISLARLDLSGSQVKDIQPLSGLRALESLNLSQTPVDDISPLKELSLLREVNLAGTKIHDVFPLVGLNIRELDLRHTPVTDVSPLASISALQRLRLFGSQAQNISSLAANRTLVITR